MENKILNPEQIKAIEHGSGPLLIIAGAGTGKTTVITERIKHLITKELAKPAEILALTFTEKASREMENRVDVALPYGFTQMWISTFHGFCDRVLKMEALHIGLNPAYKLITEAEATLFLRKNLFQFELEYFRPLGNPNKFISGLLQHFSRLQDEDISPEQYLEWVKNQREKNVRAIHEPARQLAGLPLPEKRSKDVETRHGASLQSNDIDEDLLKYHELASAYQKYTDLKIKNGLMDFADLITNTLKLFRTRKNILRQYQNQFKYFLVDEYQDTNIAQNELVKLLSGEKQNLTVVCDDDQAIYKWRGASISNVIQFRKSFPKAKLVVLTKNYRSTQEILDRAYDLIQNNNPDRLEVKEKIDKKLRGERKIKGERIEFTHLDRVENEAEYVTKKIIDLTSVETCHGTSLQYKDFAILVRANNHAEPFVRALSRHNIPFQFLGPGLLYRQGEVKDLIAYLKVLNNFEDNVSFYRLLSMDLFDINPKDIASLLNLTRKLNISLFESCEKVLNSEDVPDGTSFHINYKYNYLPSLQPKSIEKIKLLTEIINRHLKIISKDTAGQILYYFLKDSGLLNKLTDYKSATDEKKAQNISKFFNKLKSYEMDHEDASVHAVVDWIDLSMEMGESPLASDTDWVENNAVNILTVHSSKGLEFPVVFVVNLVTLRFPTIERHEQIPIPDDLVKEILPVGDSHLEEERRLFYVAATRARDLLFLTAADFYGEGKREKKLSPFITETLGEKAVSKKLKNEEANQLSLLEWEKQIETVSPKTKTPVNFLSFSQLGTYKTCPLQYKYRYVLRIPVPAGAAASFGDSMHKTLYTLYKELQNGKVLTQDELLDTLKNYWVPLGYESRGHEEKMKKRGEIALRGFYQDVFDKKTKVVSLEQIFTLPLSPTLKIGGKIDRVDDLGGGKIEIIDYKTGKVPTPKQIEKDLQMTIYALAASSKWLYDKDPKDITLSFYFFETKEKISNERSKEQLESAKAEIIKKSKEIEACEFAPTPGPHCSYCDYRMICEAWK